MNLGFQNIRYYTPYQVFNPYQDRLRNKLLVDLHQNYPKYNFSQIGYQIMNHSIIKLKSSQANGKLQSSPPKVSAHSKHLSRILSECILHLWL